MNPTTLNADWNWLESKGRRYDRYDTGTEAGSVWVCGYCGMEDVDPDEHDDECEVLDPDEYAAQCEECEGEDG